MDNQQRQSLPPAASQGALDAATQTAWKLAAAQAAVAAIPDEAVLGLGSGTTAMLMVRELAARIQQQGLRVTGVPTSEQTRATAAALGIPLADLNDVPVVTMSIDGADEVTFPRLDLIKGLGGALLREKLVASASRYRVIIADATKAVAALASARPIPVEVIPFGWRHTAGRLAALGARVVLRTASDATPGDPNAAPYVTDTGNYILDCSFGPIPQPDMLAGYLKATVGVVEHGLFIGMTDRVYLAGPDGVRSYDRPR